MPNCCVFCVVHNLHQIAFCCGQSCLTIHVPIIYLTICFLHILSALQSHWLCHKNQPCWYWPNPSKFYTSCETFNLHHNQIGGYRKCHRILQMVFWQFQQIKTLINFQTKACRDIWHPLANLNQYTRATLNAISWNSELKWPNNFQGQWHPFSIPD